jgi:hypothetical protein
MSSIESWGKNGEGFHCMVGVDSWWLMVGG